MHYEQLKRRVLAAVRSSPNGVALVFPDGDGAWIAQYRDPPRTDVFKTQAQATAHIHRDTPQDTPVIIIDI